MWCLLRFLIFVYAWWFSSGLHGSHGVLGQWRGELLVSVQSLGRRSGSGGVLLDVWFAGPTLVMPGYMLGVARGCKGSCVFVCFFSSMCFQIRLFIRMVEVAAFPLVLSMGRAVPLRGFVMRVIIMGCGVQFSVCRSLVVPIRRLALPAMSLWVPAYRFVCVSLCPTREVMLLVCLFVFL